MKRNDLLFMIEQAVKAPSGHNTQPWLFRLFENEDKVELYPNADKELKVVDTDRRELFISLGCAVENLSLAASSKGYSLDVSIAEDGVITVQFTFSDTVKEHALFKQIGERQTNRSVYNGSVLKESLIYSLQEIGKEENVNVYMWLNGSPEFGVIADYVLRGNEIQMKSKEFKKELSDWIRYNRSHTLQTRDGLSYEAFGAPDFPRWMSELIMKSFLNPFMQNKGDKKKIQSSSHFVLFTTRNDSVVDWINLGRTLERFLLELTSQGIAYAFLNQPCEVKPLSVGMARSLLLEKEYPAILIRIGYGKKMPYSLRKPVDDVLI